MLRLRNTIYRLNAEQPVSMYKIDRSTAQKTARVNTEATKTISQAFRFAALSSVSSMLLHQGDDLLFLNPDIIFTNIIKRIFEMVLDIIKAYENETVQDRHNIFQVC